MCHLFRLGSPLCHLYNLLIPSFITPSSSLYAPLPAPKQIEYDYPSFLDSPDGIRNWAKRPENAKTCQKYIAMFCMAIKQRREEGRWSGEIWALHELWGKSGIDDVEAYDSTGLMKVLHTVELMLDNLPESAMSPMSPTTPWTGSGHHHSMSFDFNSRNSYDFSGAMGIGGAMMGGSIHDEIQAQQAVAVDMVRSATTTSTGSAADANAFKSVEELVASEKSYVQELEILVRCSNEFVAAQLISTDTCHKIFSNLTKILEFHVSYCV